LWGFGINAFKLINRDPVHTMEAADMTVQIVLMQRWLGWVGIKSLGVALWGKIIIIFKIKKKFKKIYFLKKKKKRKIRDIFKISARTTHLVMVPSLIPCMHAYHIMQVIVCLSNSHHVGGIEMRFFIIEVLASLKRLC
jgi:hypothetical protein